ncbi:hypothetical protein [Paraburkholderia saeva]|uniref:hypothetical protein n=1 Tax=Paraburkholderia saeva TaxID=2777537 RepID=UPI001E453E3B|nr:hypothetical protein [Paraburkholderia saeva]
MYVSSVAWDILCFSFGYSASFDRKKQYLQSILQVDPLGLASKWKQGGAFGSSMPNVEVRDSDMASITRPLLL